MRFLTKENTSKFLTYKKDPDDERDFIFKIDSDIPGRPYKKTLATLPTSVDHTYLMTKVKDQGNLGSCVGFAVTAMKEWQETREHLYEVSMGKKDHRKGKQYDLSESWVYWNSKKIDPWPNEEGTSIRFAMKVLHKIGVPCETAWPYKDIDFGKPQSWGTLVARWSLIHSYWRVKNLSELKVGLLNGPVVIGIPCFDTIFYADETGLIAYPRYPDEIYGGHALCAVGYSDKKYGGVIKVKNSWGRYWGDTGYGYIPYKYIDDFLWDAWACKDLSVTKEMLKENKSLFDL
jgi:C1A family cysteine protease